MGSFSLLLTGFLLNDGAAKPDLSKGTSNLGLREFRGRLNKQEIAARKIDIKHLGASETESRHRSH